MQQAPAEKNLTSFIGFKIEPSLRTKNSPVFRHKAFCRPQNTKTKSKVGRSNAEPVMNKKHFFSKTIRNI